MLPSLSPTRLTPAAGGLPVADSLWRASEIGQGPAAVCSTGWPALDAELPGGGWPQHAVTEVLTTQPALLEWRLLSPALRTALAAGGELTVIGPPQQPHLAGLQHEGIDDSRLIWIRADQPAERLWVTEQLIKANAGGAVISWLPKARQEQIRRLQVCAHGSSAMVFLCRPEAARHEASAAPLRIHATVGLDWELEVSILKRRGPAHDGVLRLPSIPGGLRAVVTPRIRKPSRLVRARGAANQTIHEAVSDALGRVAATERASA